MCISRLAVCLWILLIVSISSEDCHKCYKKEYDNGCLYEQSSIKEQPSITQIYVTFQSTLKEIGKYPIQTFYDKNMNTDPVIQKFFVDQEISSAVQIFNGMLDLLQQSRKLRQTGKKFFQKAYRSYLVSQLYFYKRWWSSLSERKKNIMRTIASTKYFEVLNGAITSETNNLAYYDDIIENMQNGLIFLAKELSYTPKIGYLKKLSSFQMWFMEKAGFEGVITESNEFGLYLYQKSMQKNVGSRILVYAKPMKQKIDQILKYQEDVNMRKQICLIKEIEFNQMRNQMVSLSKSSENKIISYIFGGGSFKKADSYSYGVIQSMMEQLSMEKCNKIVSIYQNPTQFFKRSISELIQTNRSISVFDISQQSKQFSLIDRKIQIVFRGVFRKFSQYLQDCYKFYILLKLASTSSQRLISTEKELEKLSDFMSFLQRSSPKLNEQKSTERQLEIEYYLNQTKDLITKMQNLSILKESFKLIFSSDYKEGSGNKREREEEGKKEGGGKTEGEGKKEGESQVHQAQEGPQPLLTCSNTHPCQIPPNIPQKLSLKFVYTGIDHPINTTNMLRIALPQNQFYQPEDKYLHYHQIVCICLDYIQCKCYLHIQLNEYSYGEIILIKKHPANVTLHDGDYWNGAIITIGNYSFVMGDQLTIKEFKHEYSIGVWRNQSNKLITKHTAKSMLPKVISTLKNVYFVIQTENGSILLITIARKDPQIMTVEVIHSQKDEELYIEFRSQVKNKQQYFVDENGFFVVKKILSESEMISSFVYIQDQDGMKMSVNTMQPSILQHSKQGSITLLSVNSKKFIENHSPSAQVSSYPFSSKFILALNNSDYSQRLIQLSSEKNIYLQLSEVSSSSVHQQFPFDPQYIKEWKSLINSSDYIKYSFKMSNNTILLRVDNLHNERDQEIGLYVGNVSTYLTLFYGISVEFEQIKELSLGGNMELQKMFDQKWNWGNHTLGKSVLGEKITLKSLQIRVFALINVKFASSCKSIYEITRSKIKVQSAFNHSKPKISFEEPSCLRNIKEYQTYKDHCKDISPVMLENQDAYQKSKSHPQEILWKKLDDKSNKDNSSKEKHLTKELCCDNKEKKSSDPVDQSFKTYEMIKQKIINKDKIERSQKRMQTYINLDIFSTEKNSQNNYMNSSKRKSQNSIRHELKSKIHCFHFGIDTT